MADKEPEVRDTLRPAGPPNFMRDEFPLIKRQVLFATFSLLGAVLVIGASSFVQSWQEEGRQRAQQARDAARAKLAEAENEKREILNFQPKFMQLRAKNIVGDEKRLDWIDSIRRIQDERNFLPISYDILAQQAFVSDPAIQTANLELRGSRMGLSMKLLHEMDLFNFLQQLHERHFFLPLTCNIQRIGPTQENPQPTGMSADCTLLFVTMKEKTAP